MDLPLLRFTDGVIRLVYSELRGQYVLDEDGQPVYGVWLNPDEYQGPLVRRAEVKDNEPVIGKNIGDQ